jgi:uncharacterized protein GlcG (DUF336 family)
MRPAFFRGLLLPACLLAAQGMSSASADDVLVSFRSLSPEVALEMAQAALDKCRGEDFQVSVAVVDRMGVVQVLLRDRYAGSHTPDTARQLAWTAVSFRTDTLRLAADTTSAETAGARHIDGVVMIGGGIPVTASGSIVAGIGISGTPTGEANDACARAGIAAVAAKLELAD